MKKKVGILTEKDWQRLREEIRPIVEEVVEEKIEKTKPYWADKMMTALDKAAGDYKKFDEEKTVLSGQVSDHNEAIEDIDERVKKIEQKFGIASA